jgi:hypothetical protein
MEKSFFKLMQTFVCLKPSLFFVFYCSIMKLNKPAAGLVDCKGQWINLLHLFLNK